MRRMRWLAVPAVLVVVGLAGVLSFRPLVLREVERRAQRFGAQVTVQSVRPTWVGARLEGVSLRFADLPDTSVSLGELLVDATLSGGVRGLEAHGASVSSTLALERVVEGLKALRGRLGSERASSETKPVPVSLDEGRVQWASAGQRVEFEGLSVRRMGGPIEAKIRKMSGAALSVAVEGEGVVASLDRRDEGWRLVDVRLGGLSIRADLGAAGGGAAVAGSAVAAGSEGHMASLGGKVLVAKGRVHAGARWLSESLPAGAKASAGALSIELRRGDDVLHVGPGALLVASRADHVEVSFENVAEQGTARPVQLRTIVPFDDASVLKASLRGGPVTLAMLGVHERDLGLLDVATATVEVKGEVEIAGDARSGTVDLEGKLGRVAVEHPKLSNQPVRGLDLGFAVKGAGAFDASVVHVEKGVLEVGSVRADVSGKWTREGDAWSVDGRFGVPLASCQGAVDAMPAGLAAKVQGMKLSGTFALSGGVVFDAKKPGAGQVSFDLRNDCKVVDVPAEVSVARFRQPFQQLVYGPDGKRATRETGPGTAGWVSIGGISPHMMAAVMTTEDGAFRRHRGFDLEAIRNSIRENVRARRFVRGASTISMQTAKNVYLDRDKTVGRKLQEALLTLYLEQALSKDELMELYLNSIEFGPMIYGVSAAAQHYFKTTAAQLSLGQALYLASILPNPKQQHFGADGKVTERHMAYLRRLMRLMAKIHLIREDEMQEGLEEWVQFGVPSSPRDKNVVDPAVDEAGGGGDGEP